MHHNIFNDARELTESHAGVSNMIEYSPHLSNAEQSKLKPAGMLDCEIPVKLGLEWGHGIFFPQYMGKGIIARCI